MSLHDVLADMELDPKAVSGMTDSDLRLLGAEVLQAQRDDTRENQGGKRALSIDVAKIRGWVKF